MSFSVCAAPNILNSGQHASYPYIQNAINAVLGSGIVDSSIYVDIDTLSTIVIPVTTLIGDSNNSLETFYSAATHASVNHAPYAVLNHSGCCSRGTFTDGQLYASLVGLNATLTYPVAVAFGGAPPVGTAPPVSFTATSSPNSGDGGTAWGVEFGLSASYLGLDTTADSWDSAYMAGFIAALKYTHSSWNWFDIKAALRQTASQWATGYTPTGFGYGAPNWTAANTAVSLYLQPPGFTATSSATYATLTLYPFRQTRRVQETIYAVNPAYVWPIKNEYTAADITASGATLLYTSNGSDVVPVYYYSPVTAGSITFIAFTTDGAGHYSRAEVFSELTLALDPGSVCMH